MCSAIFWSSFFKVIRTFPWRAYVHVDRWFPPMCPSHCISDAPLIVNTLFITICSFFTPQLIVCYLHCLYLLSSPCSARKFLVSSQHVAQIFPLLDYLPLSYLYNLIGVTRLFLGLSLCLAGALTIALQILYFKQFLHASLRHFMTSLLC